MIKTTETALHLPTVNLEPDLVQLPNVVFTISLPFNDVRRFFTTYTSSNIEVSESLKRTVKKLNLIDTTESNQKPFPDLVVESISRVNENRDVKPFVIATHNIKSPFAVVSNIIRIKLMDSKTCSISLKGLFKGMVVMANTEHTLIGESIISATENDSNIDLNEIEHCLTAVNDCISLSKQFVKDFTSSDTDFKNLLAKLNPLATMLFIQLNGSYFKILAEEVNRVTLKESNKFLQLCDAFVSVFPFSTEQQIRYLSAPTIVEQISVIKLLTDFVKELFEEYLDVSYLHESWIKLGKQRNGRALQSKFIVSQFKNLKALLDTLDDGLENKPQKTMSSSEFKDDDDDDDLHLIDAFIDNLNNLDISEDAKKMLNKDFKRLKKMQSSTTEYQQLRNYFDIVMDLPWPSLLTTVNTLKDISLQNAKEMLDRDHFGMDAAKQRILEYIAISKLMSSSNNQQKSPILLLNGPPGVGKTSIAKSVAHCLGYEFQRISLGGINDFADMKGHRRTYVGAGPGLIIQALRKSNSMKLVILLDEIDKIGMPSHKGNPEAALLEVLDPEQNVSFNDHYLGFPINLSQIIFIATSNDKWEISAPLFDRMETIDLDGYTGKEKVEIGERFIIPRQIKRNGLKPEQVNISKDIINEIVDLYTHEAGIRNLERLIGKICRKKAIETMSVSNYNPVVRKEDLIMYLGVPATLSDSDKYSSGDSNFQEPYGLVNGLSYNSDGSGSLLKFEMVGVPGSQRISATGMVGEVLMESCSLAETLVEQLIHTHEFSGYDSKVLSERLSNTSVHMHVPQGSIRKDGPSAGLTMTICYLSLILKLPVPSNIAMTGEVTLTYKALPIGGLKEKLLGASMSGKIDKVIVPRLNRQNLIAAYTESFKDRDAANIKLTKLILEEESCLNNLSRRYSFSGEVEAWVRQEYMIEIKYVDDFMDILRYVWADKTTVKRKETKAHL
ncbi:hypothetical protein CANINC_000467 [Pichia inconspicua]|uniref:endopeptidase La n=1 Tax=Pichia inconspicua TaxID=52247 RepID=A0A4T0X6I5_9ASCO|nr:hypothetical protein CANINC_000467 [[Candida] inconspicua]